MRLRIFLEPGTDSRNGRVSGYPKISTKVANPDKVELDFEADGEGPKAMAKLSLQRLSLVGSS